MGSWDINRAWHGMGSCNKGKSLIIGILGDACIRKRCLFAINGSSSFGSAIELDKLSHSSPDFAQWLGDKSRCYKPKGGQTASPSTEPPLVSFIFTVYNNDAMVAKAILEVFRTAHEVSSAEFVILHDGHTEPMPLTRTLLSNMKELFGTNIKQLKHETAQGYGASNNEALAAATGTYAVLLNSDVQVMPSWLAVLMKTMLSYPGKLGYIPYRHPYKPPCTTPCTPPYIPSYTHPYTPPCTHPNTPSYTPLYTPYRHSYTLLYTPL